MTFELSPIVGNTFDGFKFKVKHCDSEVLKRVKSEVVESMRKKGYSIDNFKGKLER